MNCQWGKSHGKAVVAVRYDTPGEGFGTKRIERNLCQRCADAALRNGYAHAVVVRKTR